MSMSTPHQTGFLSKTLLKARQSIHYTYAESSNLATINAFCHLHRHQLIFNVRHPGPSPDESPMKWPDRNNNLGIGKSDRITTEGTIAVGALPLISKAPWHGDAEAEWRFLGVCWWLWKGREGSPACGREREEIYHPGELEKRHLTSGYGLLACCCSNSFSNE